MGELHPGKWRATPTPSDAKQVLSLVEVLFDRCVWILYPTLNFFHPSILQHFEIPSLLPQKGFEEGQGRLKNLLSYHYPDSSSFPLRRHKICVVTNRSLHLGTEYSAH